MAAAAAANNINTSITLVADAPLAPPPTATATALSPPPTFCDDTLVAVERLLFRPLSLRLDVEADSHRQSTEKRHLIRASSVGGRGREGGRERCRCGSDY